MKSPHQFTDLLNGPFGTSVVLQAAAKYAPGIGHFIQGAYGAGYAADEILDFLRNKYGNKDQQRDHRRLEERADSGMARPDEMAALTRMEQKSSAGNAAAATFKRTAQALGGAVNVIGAQPAAGAENSSSNTQNPVQPSSMQPQSPVAPQIAQNAPPSAPAGQGIQSPLPINQKSAQNTPNFDQMGGFFSQFPELSKFLEKNINEGKSPIEAAQEARKKRMFGPLIDKVERDAGKFEDVVQYIFQGSGQKAAPKEDAVESALINLLKRLGG